MTRIANVLLWSSATVGILAVSGLVYKTVAPPKVRAASGSAYTVLRTESSFDKAGKLQYRNEYLEARRSDNTIMKSRKTQTVQVRTLMFPNGSKVELNEVIGKKSTYPSGFQAVQAHRSPDASCLSQDDLAGGWVSDGTDTIGGHPAVRVRQKTSQRSIMAWYALDAGCALVQGRFEHETGVTTQNLASLVAGEPDQALFQVPGTFQEVPPSELHPPVCVNGDCHPTMPDAIQQQMDRKYYALRGGR